jgi:DNA end-binding protein Ku
MRSVWKGSISFGLVAIPIELYSATEEHKVAFHQVHADDGGRIRYRRFCTAGGEEVPYSEIAKGYELPDGELVILTDEDFADLPLASRREIEVLSFVDAGSIDPVQLSRSYHCAPTERGVKPYVLLRDALARAEKVAMVKVAVRSRESLAVLRPRGKGLVLQLMLWPDEVREPDLSFVDDVRLRPQEVEVAGAYVEALTGDVDPGQLVDRYRVALDQLIEAKVAGRQVEQPPAAASLNGVDLMDALRRSIEAAKGGQAARASRSPAKRGTAKSAPRQPAKTATARSHRDPAKKSSTARKKTTATKTTAKKTTAKKATAKKATAKRSAAK